MSYRPTIAVYYDGEIAEVGYYRNWHDFDLLLECAVLACIVDGVGSIDDARSLLSWYDGRLRELRNWGAAIKEVWSGHDEQGRREDILANNPYPPEPYNRDDLKQFERHSENPIIVDASARCVYHGTRSLSEAELTMIPLFDAGPDAREDAISQQLRTRRIPFDLLLSEESPVHYALTHAQARVYETNLGDESSDPRQPSRKPLPPDTSLFDPDLFDWSIRAGNCLRRAGITTVGQLATMNEHDLLQIRNLGIKSIYEIEDQLAIYGMGLAGESQE